MLLFLEVFAELCILDKTIVSLFLPSDGNNTNVDGKQFALLKVHLIQSQMKYE